MNINDFVKARKEMAVNDVIRRATKRQIDYIQLQNCMRILARECRVTVPSNATAFDNLFMKYGLKPFTLFNGLIRGRLNRYGDISLHIS